MQNLLNEEDFLQQTHYNPFKRFLVFCGIAIVHIAVTYFFTGKVEGNTARPYIFLSLFVMLVMPFFMILDDKKVQQCRPVIILQGIQLLMGVYFFANFAATLALNNFTFSLFYLNSYIYVFLCFILYGFFCFGCIWLVLRYKKRKQN